jgi:UDP-glucose 4-epimerase
MMMAAVCDAAYGEVFNVGLDHPTTFKELAEVIIDVAKSGRWEYAPFTPERAAQDPGDFYSDITKIRKIVGWEPSASLADGLRETIEFYRQYKSHYW